ncbi:hypothetical protein EV424DRAFT_1347643 [Suillus variegatus]|nr:hypothetical protein EV424DRAFT_1347643 [Suillus variegatus]
MSYVMSANAGIDWRPITICVTSDILAMGADHLKDKEEEFSSDRNNANDPRLASWFFVQFRHSSPRQHSLLWTTPISFKKFWLILRRLLGGFGRDRHQPSTSAPILVIKRIPGMKAIFYGIIRGCSTYAVVFSVLSGSGSLTNAAVSMERCSTDIHLASSILIFLYNQSCQIRNQTLPKFADCKIHEAMHSPADAYFGILGRQNLLGVNRRQQIPTSLHRRTGG